MRVFCVVFGVLILLGAIGAQAARIQVRELPLELSAEMPDWAVSEKRCSNAELDPATTVWLESILEMLRREDEALGLDPERVEARRVPVNFWVVVTKSEKGMVDVKQLDSQLKMLNKKLNKTGIKFMVGEAWALTYNKGYKDCLPFKKNGKVNGTFKKLAKYVKNQMGVSTRSSINVFTCNPKKDMLGMSPYPWTFREGDYRDAVGISYKTLPRGAKGLYNKGMTLAHELGHYFGELHTFANGCNAPGDYINDTPYEASPAYEAVPRNNCARGRDTCPQPGLDPVKNPMDYSSDYCMTKFTNGQNRDMKLLIREFRNSLGRN